MRAVHWILAALGVAGLAAFVARVGAPNLVGSGTAYTERSAVSQLRTLHWAEGLFLRGTHDDADGDGKGEFATLSQLASLAPAQRPLPAPILQIPGGRFAGEVLESNGYCFTVFVPDDVDARERGFLAYAWPAQGELPARAFCLDQDERILETKGRHRFVGCANLPPRDACLGDAEVAWGPWRNKQSRRTAGQDG